MIETPCIGICSTVYGDEICRGCKRQFEDIIQWNAMDADARALVWQRLNSQAEQALQVCGVEVVDTALLDAALNKFNVRVTEFHQSAYRVCMLLKQVADRLPSLADCGLRSDLDIATLAMRLDDRFYDIAGAD